MLVLSRLCGALTLNSQYYGNRQRRSRKDLESLQASSAEVTSGNKPLDLALSAINRQFGEGTLIKMGERSHRPVDVIPTGSVAIDLALGVGGLPRGRICDIYSPESSGKTTFCLSIIAEAQRRGGNAVFIDVEHALDPSYARVIIVELIRNFSCMVEL